MPSPGEPRTSPDAVVPLSARRMRGGRWGTVLPPADVPWGSALPVAAVLLALLPLVHPGKGRSGQPSDPPRLATCRDSPDHTSAGDERQRSTLPNSKEGYALLTVQRQPPVFGDVSNGNLVKVGSVNPAWTSIY